MLVMTRKQGQAICVGDQIVVTICSIRGNRVQIGVTAPADCSIRRSELAKHVPLKGDKRLAGDWRQSFIQ